MKSTYDPFTYQPMMRAYFEGAQHANAVEGFNRWAKNNAPELYAKIIANPILTDGTTLVQSGALGGLGDYDYILDAPPPAPQPDGSWSNTITQWGNSMLDLTKGVYATKAQRDLIELNIQRAERGLPPLDAGSVAPQVNVGVSPQVQQLIMYGIAGMIGIGGLLVLSKRRK